VVVDEAARGRLDRLIHCVGGRRIDESKYRCAGRRPFEVHQPAHATVAQHPPGRGQQAQSPGTQDAGRVPGEAPRPFVGRAAAEDDETVLHVVVEGLQPALAVAGFCCFAAYAAQLADEHGQRGLIDVGVADLFDEGVGIGIEGLDGGLGVVDTGADLGQQGAVGDRREAAVELDEGLVGGLLGRSADAQSDGSSGRVGRVGGRDGVVQFALLEIELSLLGEAQDIDVGNLALALAGVEQEAGIGQRPDPHVLFDVVGRAGRCQVGEHAAEHQGDHEHVPATLDQSPHAGDEGVVVHGVRARADRPAHSLRHDSVGPAPQASPSRHGGRTAWSPRRSAWLLSIPGERPPDQMSSADRRRRRRRTWSPRRGTAAMVAASRDHPRLPRVRGR